MGSVVGEVLDNAPIVEDYGATTQCIAAVRARRIAKRDAADVASSINSDSPGCGQGKTKRRDIRVIGGGRARDDSVKPIGGINPRTIRVNVPRSVGRLAQSWSESCQEEYDPKDISAGNRDGDP